MSDPEVVDRLHRLHRLGAEPLTADDVAALARHAHADPAACRAVARQVMVHGLLGLALEGDARRAAFAARVTAALVPEAAAFTAQVVERISSRERGRPRPPDVLSGRGRPRSQRSHRVAFALAASLLVSVVLVLATVADHAAVALLVRAESTAWVAAPPAIVQSGTRLHLARGLIEIELLGRGNLIVEGPADLEFASATRAVLHRGRLVMHATERGHGYRVETPGGTLVDLGTRFGVSVGADGATEAHVIEGSIEAIASDGGRAVLAGDAAARLGAAGVERIAADRDAFYTALPPRAATAPDRLHWPLDEGTGVTARAIVQGFAGKAADLTLRATDNGMPPTWIPGRFGQALAFAGNGAYAESPFPGIAGTRARTVACWVKMPRDFTPRDGFALVSWGHFSSAGRGAVWQLSLNPLVAEGPLGRIRVGTHGGLLVGTTDLRDDAWHHIAVVMYGGEGNGAGGGARPDIGTHVLVYLDGELEPISRRTLHSIDTRVDGAGHGVWLGRNVTYTDERRSHPAGFLRGAIDEVVIVAGALDREAILRLREGRLP